MKKKYFMPKLSESQVNRLEEIKFYLFVVRMVKLFEKARTGYDFSNMVTMFAELNNVDPVTLEQASILITKERNRPSKDDILILTKYQNLPYRFISKNFAGYRQLYNKIDEFIKNPEEKLEQRLEDNIVNEIKKFNKNYIENMHPQLYILGTDIENGSTVNDWDSWD